MRGVLAEFSALSSRAGSLQWPVAPGSTDRAEHGRLSAVPRSGEIRRRFAAPATYVRIVAALAITGAAAVVVSGMTHGALARLDATLPFGALFGQVVLAPAVLAVAVFVSATVAALLWSFSASPGTVSRLARRGWRHPSVASRGILNGIVWSTIAALAIHYTAPAFDPVPGGAFSVAVVLAGVVGWGTTKLHRAAFAHDAYRTFNLVAMVLAAGSLASMSTTTTGAWWSLNFSTLGTTDDDSARYFNAGVMLSGLGIATLAPIITKPLEHARFRARRFGIGFVRGGIIAIGVCLVGVGAVPIDDLPEVHNTFALGAAAAFALSIAVLAVLIPAMPRGFLGASLGALGVECVAMYAYDGLGIFSLTVFEIIAFGLMFAWLIALVVVTHGAANRSDLGETLTENDHSDEQQDQHGDEAVVLRHPSASREQPGIGPDRRDEREHDRPGDRRGGDDGVHGDDCCRLAGREMRTAHRQPGRSAEQHCFRPKVEDDGEPDRLGRPDRTNRGQPLRHARLGLAGTADAHDGQDDETDPDHDERDAQGRLRVGDFAYRNDLRQRDGSGEYRCEAEYPSDQVRDGTLGTVGREQDENGGHDRHRTQCHCRSNGQDMPERSPHSRLSYRRGLRRSAEADRTGRSMHAVRRR